jgi:hypothetical protein
MCSASKRSAVVDMSAAAVTARLVSMAKLLRARGFVCKGVGMSPTEVTGRLRAMAELSSMCQRLGQASLQGPVESSPRGHTR